MPNHVDNDLFIKGTKDELSKFKETMAGLDHQGKQVLLSEEKLIPYPQKYRELDEISAKYGKEHPKDWSGRPKDGFNQGGYDWCINNWGTKWGFYNVELVDSEDGQLSYNFNTAWAPPIPLIRKMGELFPELKFKLKYYESGSCFKGTMSIKKGNVASESNSSYSGSRGG